MEFKNKTRLNNKTQKDKGPFCKYENGDSVEPKKLSFWSEYFFFCEEYFSSSRFDAFEVYFK